MPKVSECWISISFFFFLHDIAEALELYTFLLYRSAALIFIFPYTGNCSSIQIGLFSSLDVPTNVYVFLVQLQVKYWTLKNVILDSGGPLLDWAHGVVQGC